MHKKELRKQVLQKRDALTQTQRREKSSAIAGRVMTFHAFKDAKTVLLFASFRSEVDTSELFEAAIAEGKQVYYPKVIGKEMEFYRVESELDLEEGAWGIREPKAEAEKRFVSRADEVVCIILPGVVFDKAGNRIGYGGGYYDKFLQKLEAEWDKYEIDDVYNIIPCNGFQNNSIQNNDIQNNGIKSNSIKRKSVCCVAVAFDCQMVESGIIMQEVHDRKLDCIVTESNTFLCNRSWTK